MCRALRVPFVPLSFVGAAADALEWARAHASDPAVLMRQDLPTLPDNIGEGFVVRPVRDALWNQGRVMLKAKSETFNETCRQVQPDLRAGEMAAAAAAAACLVIPRARLEAVMSKQLPDDIGMHNFKQLNEALFQDVWRDQPEFRADPKPLRIAVVGICPENLPRSSV